MFLLEVLGNWGIYSTEQKARQSGIRFINTHCHNRVTADHYINHFRDLIGREDYAGAVKYWNDTIVNNMWLGNSLYKIQIKKTEIDKDL